MEIISSSFAYDSDLWKVVRATMKEVGSYTKLSRWVGTCEIVHATV